MPWTKQHRIVAAHGGSISIQSTEGKGTTVTATLRADLHGPAAMPTDIKILREAAA